MTARNELSDSFFFAARQQHENAWTRVIQKLQKELYVDNVYIPRCLCNIKRFMLTIELREI